MALKLGPCFSGFAFPIAVAVLSVFEFVARLGQPSAWFGTAFHGPRLAATRALPDQAGGNGLGPSEQTQVGPPSGLTRL